MLADYQVLNLLRPKTYLGESIQRYSNPSGSTTTIILSAVVSSIRELRLRRIEYKDGSNSAKIIFWSEMSLSVYRRHVNLGANNKRRNRPGCLNHSLHSLQSPLHVQLPRHVGPKKVHIFLRRLKRVVTPIKGTTRQNTRKLVHQRFPIRFEYNHFPGSVV